MAEDTSTFEITRGNARAARTLYDWFGGHEQRITFFDDLSGGCSKEELGRKYTDGFLYDQVKRLQSLGLVKETTDAYRLTELGEIIYDSFLDIAEYSVFVSDIGPLLYAIEDWEEILPEIELFLDADIIVENDLEPTEAIMRYREELNETTEIREIVCGVMDSQGFRGLAGEGKLTAECLYTPKIMDYILSDPDRREIAREHRETGVVSHYRLDESFPFNLSLLDQTTIIWSTRAEASGHRVLLASESADVREWAENLYASKKQDAEEYTFEEEP